MNGLMFDTNVFNRILDGGIDASSLKEKECLVTHVQFDEIKETKNEERRSQLERIFIKVISTQLPTESLVVGISRLDKTKLGDGVTYKQILHRLNQLNKSKQNNIQDALIAETALINKMILVTEDRDLAQVVNEYGGTVCNLQQVLSV